MKKLLAILFSVLFFLPAAKGQNGEIYGFLKDSKGNPLSDVLIRVYIGDKIYNGCFSEEDGGFSIKPLTAGSYNVEFSLNGFLKRKTTGVIVTSGGSVKVNCKMIKGSCDSEMVVAYKKPKIDTVIPIAVPIIDNNKIQSYHKYPWQNDHLTLYEKDRLIIGGNRGDTTIYLIDGLLDYKNEAADSSANNWLNKRNLRNKTFTEKDIQYIPFQHFLETLPAFQR